MLSPQVGLPPSVLEQALGASRAQHLHGASGFGGRAVVAGRLILRVSGGLNLTSV